MRKETRPPRCRRTWLFLPGAERDRLRDAAASGADVLIQELEDFTPPERRAEARALTAETLRLWRAAGAVATVRINPLDGCGLDDLDAVIPARSDAVLLAMTNAPDEVRALDAELTRRERALGLPEGDIEIVPNIETARALVSAGAIAAASPRVAAMLLATEDLAADLDAERTREGRELDYARRRFLVECVAANVVAIDCPWTFGDAAGAEADARFARSLGYAAKSLVAPAHAAPVNRALTPSREEAERAARLVAAFEAARAEGRERAEVDGLLVEVPTYRAARRLIARRDELARYEV